MATGCLWKLSKFLAAASDYCVSRFLMRATEPAALLNCAHLRPAVAASQRLVECHMYISSPSSLCSTLG